LLIDEDSVAAGQAARTNSDGADAEADDDMQRTKDEGYVKD
jgi:hypothetical protein